VLVPCVAPKFPPLIVTAVPTLPVVGDRLVMLGADPGTVNAAPLLATPPTLTMTFPVVVPAGTGTTMLVADQFVGAAMVPLKKTRLVPWIAPKLAPAIVTAVPTLPVVGDRLVMLGADPVTVNAGPLLATPPTVTVTGPVVAPLGTEATIPVALQLVGVAFVPLKRTVLVPCVAPKFPPLIVTAVPTLPLVGDRLVILGPVVTMPTSKKTSADLGLTIELVLYA
jgi:hypothetical protein